MSSKRSKNYTKANLEEAIYKIKNKECKISEASRFYKIPKQTFSDRINKNLINIGSGTTTRLSQITEELLVHILIKLAEWGYGLKFTQLQVVIVQY